MAVMLATFYLLLLQKGPAYVRERIPEGAPAGGLSYEHPKAREARLAAQAVAESLPPEELPDAEAEAPEGRGLVVYDDI